jgi:hypothetical protein
MHKRVYRSRRPIARRLGAATLALAALVCLGACKASGGGYIGEPLDGGPVSVFQERAHFAFNYSCKDKSGDQPRIKGHLNYRDGPSVIDGVEFPAIRLHGTVDALPAGSGTSCAEAAAAQEGLPVVLFEGTYRSRRETVPPGRFTVVVLDQGEPGHSVGDFTGDSFAIELIGGGYDRYTRAGYLEGGNIQVE